MPANLNLLHIKLLAIPGVTQMLRMVSMIMAKW